MVDLVAHHSLKGREAVRFMIMRSIGNFLLLLSLYGVGMTFGPALYYETTFRLAQAKGVHYKIEEKAPATTQAVSTIDAGPGLGALLSASKEQVLIPKDTQFSIVIPKIGASAKIYPNIDPSNPEEFLPVLQKGVAHAKGTVFPGMKGNIYLFAHSTDNWWNVGRYNAVFYLLKDLAPGDEIAVFFENKRHNYLVDKSVIVDPTETSFLVNSRGPEERLILQTCWPPGTTWKRLIVIAKPKT